MKSRKSNDKHIDVYVSTFHPDSDASRGHTTIDAYDKNGEKVTFVGPDNQEKHARLSVFPSSRPYSNFPQPVQMVFDFFGLNVKTNVVGDLTGVPVEGFSARNLESDIRYQEGTPTSIIKYSDVEKEKFVKAIEDKHTRLSNGEDQFVLNYKTGITPFILKALQGGSIEATNFETRCGHAMPDDLIHCGGGSTIDCPNDDHFTRTYNCSGAVHDVLSEVGKLPHDTSITTVYPVDLHEKMLHHNGKEMVNDISSLPKDMRRSVKQGQKKYPKPNGLFSQTIKNLGFEPDPDRDVLACVKISNSRSTE